MNLAAVPAGLCLAAFLITPAHAGPGSTAGDSFLIGVGPRPVAFGEAFVGLADDASSIAYNPAGLARLRRTEVQFSHNMLAEDVHQEWAVAAVPGPWSFAAAANLIFVKPFEVFNENDQAVGEISSQDASYHLALARLLGPLSLGVSGKYLTSRLDTHKAHTLAFDAGALLRLTDDAYIGISALNMGGGTLRYIDQENELPRAFKAGASWTMLRRKSLGRALTMIADATVPAYDDPFVAGGFELKLYDALALRGGGRSRRDAGLGYSCGMGLSLTRSEESAFQIDFDYSFVDFGRLGGAHRAGITLRFGQRAPDAAQSVADMLDGSHRAPAPVRARRDRPELWQNEPKPSAPAPAPARPELQPSLKSKPKGPATPPPDESDLLRPLIYVNP